MSASIYSAAVQELYVTYFGRPADAQGLINFDAALAAINAPTDILGLSEAYNTNAAVKSLIDSFGTSTESIAQYGTIGSTLASAQSFVTAVFEHVLNRAPASTGLAFWSNAIATGNLSPGNAALAIAAGAQANTTTQGLIDAQTIANKVAVAGEFTADVSDTTGLAAYRGAAAAEAARNLLAGVGSTTVPSSYLPEIQQVVAILSGVGSVNLTTGIDNFTGGSGSIIFNAILDNAAGLAGGGAAATLNAGDVITGGTGTTTLNITDQGLGANLAIPAGATLTGITTLNLSSTENVSTQDFSHWTGLTNVNVSKSTGTANVTVAGTTALSITDTGSSGTLTTNGGSTVTVSTDANHTLTVNGGTSTTTVTITGGSGISISDANYSNSHSNSIASVTLSGPTGTTSIDSNALTTLSIIGDANQSVFANALVATAPALALTVNGDSNALIEINSAQALSVAAVTASSSNLTLMAPLATTVSFNDSVDLSLTSLTAGRAVSAIIAGSGAFSADLTAVSGTATISAANATGVTTVTLATGQTFIGGTGQDIVTETAIPSVSVAGGTATNNVIDFRNLTSTVSTTFTTVSNFATFEVSGTSSGTFNFPATNSYKTVDVEGASGDLHFQSSVPGPALSIGISDTHNIVVANTGTYAAGATSTINIGNGGTTGLTEGLVSIQDVTANGSANLTINSNSAAGQINTIGTLAAGRDSFTFAGNAAVAIGNNLALADATLTFSNSAGSATSNIAGITDNALTQLNFLGSSATTLTVLDSTATSLTIADGDSAAVNVGQIADSAVTSLTMSNTSTAVHSGLTLGSESLPVLKTLNLTGNVALTLTGDTVTTGITIAGATDNAAVSFTSTGATASGDSDTVTLGNGIDNITLGAGAATSTQTVTLGTGAGDSVTTASVGTVHVTLGNAASGTDNVVASGAGATVTVTAGNGGNHITANGAGDTVTIAVGTGANVIVTGSAATGTITTGTHTAADQVQLGTYGNAASLANIVKITGLNANGADSLVFSGGVTSVQQFGSANVTAAGGNAATLASWVATAVGLGGVVPQAAHALDWFQFSGNTYLVVTAGAGDAGVLNSADTVVELTGTSYNFGASSLQSGTVLLNGSTAQPASATFTLTTGTDTFVGNALVNTFTAILDNPAGVTASGPAATLTTGDSLTGGGGLTSNILNITDDGLGTNMAIPTSTITGIQTFNITSKEAVSTDFSGYVGLTSLNITASVGNDSITAAHTTNVALTETGTAATLSGGAVDQIHDTNYGGATPNTLATVSLINAGGASTIYSNVLTTLNLTNLASVVTVDAAAGARTLSIALNGVGGGTIVTDATATTIDINDTTATTGDVSFHFGAATAITLNDSVNFTNSQGQVGGVPLFTASNTTNFSITGSGYFNDNMTGLSPSAHIDASAATGYVTIAIGSAQSFLGGSNGIDTVTVNATPSGTLDGGGASQSQLVLDNFGVTSDAVLSHVTNFRNLGIAGNTSGNFDASHMPSFTQFTMTGDGSSGQISITNAADKTTALFEDGFASAFTILPASAGESTSVLFSDSTAKFISQLILQNGSSQGFSELDVGSSSSALPDEIGLVQDTQLTEILFTGTEATLIDNVADQASTLSVNTTGVNGGSVITNLTDNGLTTLSFDGSTFLHAASATITNLNSTSTALTITNADHTTAAVAITNLNDTSLISATFNNSISGGGSFSIGASTQASLASLTLTGNVATGIAGDAVTTGISVSGATDNANVSFSSVGATGSGANDSVTLGNGNDSVTLGVGSIGSTHTITLGSGSNTVIDSTLGSTTVSTTETSGKTETIHADSAASAAITTGNGNDTVSANAAATDVTISVGNGTNNVSVSGAGTTGSITAGTGSDTITLGSGSAVTVGLGAHAGVDAVKVGVSGTSSSAIVQITGLNNSGTDTITFAGDAATLVGFTSVTGTNVTNAGGSTANLTDWIAAADGATGSGVTGSAHTVTWFQFGGNTYLLESVAGQTADAGTMAAGNTLVELTGTGYSFAHTTGAGGVLHLLG